ncbi:MAG: transcription-repair coupling factor [Candidatus Geothermincolia bacterium]
MGHRGRFGVCERVARIPILKQLVELIEGDQRFEQLLETLGRGRGAEVGLDDPLAPAWLAALEAALRREGTSAGAGIGAGPRPLLVVTPGSEAADRLAADLAEFMPGGTVMRFPSRSLVLAGELGEDPQSVALRARGLSLLRAEDPRSHGSASGASRKRAADPRTPGRAPAGKAADHPQATPGSFVLVADLAALLLPQPVSLAAVEPLLLEKGGVYDMEEIAERLVRFGYRREYLTEAMGQFSVRGGILDVFNPVDACPLRAEFTGDRVERLTQFHPVTQRTIGAIKESAVYPVEPGLEGEEKAPLAALVPEGGLIALMDPKLAFERAQGHKEPGLLSLDEALAAARVPVVRLDPLSGDPGFRCIRPKAYRGRVDEMMEDLRDLLGKGYSVGLLLETEGRRERVAELLDEAGIPRSQGTVAPAGKSAIRPRAVALATGSLSSGLTMPEKLFTLLTESDIFGKEERRRRGRATTAGGAIESYEDLEPGNYVVHVNHGIGVYSGLVQRTLDGATREYLAINYAEGDSLYVPTDRVDLVHRYIGAEKPAVHGLTGGRWRQAKRRARAAVQLMAKELLELYADRMASPGYAFPPDEPWQREMEDCFPYEETPDQARAIEDVKGDMERAVPMDRLVYGDVGYGKTEVAIRAAFKAVMDGKQVAILVPTTILAQQHYHTFVHRCSSFPVRVEALSRFRTGPEQRRIIEELAEGKIDVVIGTHRLLQKDVIIPELGLVVIDEEHRFGVAHKERLKAIRRSVDVLTLTATPIPRTLQMSLSGIRDMSTIETPIQDRYSVIVSVGPFREDLAREAIERELARDGQVFYVHNRVQSIEAVGRKVRRMAPQARVAVAHGQMDERQLERIMDEFIEHRYDVLVCTTIIESGLDVPSVNTLIVESAELLGLAQLYHLRGRVGRSDRQAYAFFFFREGSLTQDAYRRLKVIRDFSELGSGFRVAMQDLEIRGAGNLLGAEQHGHVEAVGFELYTRLLAEAVDKLRGVRRHRAYEVTLDLPLPAFVPQAYVSSSSRRIEIYRRLSDAASGTAIEDLATEVEDRYGAPPAEVKGLFAASQLRLRCLELAIREVGHEGDSLALKFRERGEKNASALLELVGTREELKAARYNSALRELTLEFPHGAWRRRGLELARVLTGWLDAVYSGSAERPEGEVEAGEEPGGVA